MDSTVLTEFMVSPLCLSIETHHNCQPPVLKSIREISQLPTMDVEQLMNQSLGVSSDFNLSKCVYKIQEKVDDIL